MPVFWLLDRDGNDLGKHRTDFHVWPVGGKVVCAPYGVLRVVASIPSAYASDFDGYLIVELIEQEQPRADMEHEPLDTPNEQTSELRKFEE
jgi:hypothetical protein